MENKYTYELGKIFKKTTGIDVFVPFAKAFTSKRERDSLVKDRKFWDFSCKAISEVPENQGSLAEFNEIMRETPEWAEGLPIDAAGYESKRYRK